VILAAFTYLKGTRRVRQNGIERYLIDIIVETVCSCRDDPADTVQLQVRSTTLICTADSIHVTAPCCVYLCS
jgi:hypothetical protein